MRDKIDKLRVRMLSAPVIVALLFFPFFEPVGLGDLFWQVKWVFVVWKALSILMAGVFFLAHPKPSAGTVFMGLYQVVLLVSTLVNGVDCHEWAYKAGLTAGVCVLVDQCADADMKALMKGLFFSLGGLCLVNLATVLLFPGGMAGKDMYLLGGDNVFAAFVIPAMVVAVLHTDLERWPAAVQAAALAVLAAPLFITWSVTGMLGVAAFAALYLLRWVRKSYRLCNICVYYAVIAGMFLLLVFLWTPERFAFLLEDVLHKDMSLSGRTQAWAGIVKRIAQKPLLGYGKLTQGQSMGIYGLYHCHNLLLQTAFDAGLAGVAVFLVQMGLAARPLWRTRSTRSGYILAAGLFSILLYFMGEGQMYPMAYTCMLMLCYHAEGVTAVLEQSEAHK